MLPATVAALYDARQQNSEYLFGRVHRGDLRGHLRGRVGHLPVGEHLPDRVTPLVRGVDDHARSRRGHARGVDRLVQAIGNRTIGRAALNADSTVPAPPDDTTTSAPSSACIIGTKPARCSHAEPACRSPR
jgi:hypothetical protein